MSDLIRGEQVTLSCDVTAGIGYSGGAITVYERRGFRGASDRFSDDIPNLARTGLNDRIRSIQVGRRGSWEVCSDAYFRGRCRIVGKLRFGIGRQEGTLQREHASGDGRWPGDPPDRQTV